MHSQQWRRLLKPRLKMAAACCAVLALAVAACSSGGGSGSPGASPTGATGAKVIGGGPVASNPGPSWLAL